MKKRFITIILILLSVSVIKSQTLSIGPQAGFVKTKNADKSTILPAIAARLNLIGFGIEGSIGYKSEEFGNGEIKLKSYPILLTALINVFPMINAEAGIGWYNTKLDYTNFKLSENKSDIGYHIGAGTEIPLGNITLTGDIRYVFLNVDFNNAANLVSSKSDYYIICIGALFKL